MTAASDHLHAFGFVVLRNHVDPGPLEVEFDEAIAAGFADPTHSNVGAVGNRFRYLPMMCERTPVSLALVVHLAGLAEDLLESPVLPGRAKATAYLGSANWHRDSTLPIRSIGIVAYLEPLDDESGALRVLPGSHHADYGAAVDRFTRVRPDVPGMALPTTPGDVIVFDERLWHASRGGTWRRQWRVDFITDHEIAAANGEEHDELLRRYYAGQFSPGWDGGYDVESFPSYGPAWREVDQRWNQRLEALGAYAAAGAEEAAVKSMRRERDPS